MELLACLIKMNFTAARLYAVGLSWQGEDIAEEAADPSAGKVSDPPVDPQEKAMYLQCHAIA